MTIDVATGIVRILKQEGVDWVSTFPVCRVNNALGREGVPMLMMRDDRYAVAVADAFSRITGGSRIGVCTFQGGVNAAGMQYAYAGPAQVLLNRYAKFTPACRQTAAAIPFCRSERTRLATMSTIELVDPELREALDWRRRCR